MKATELRQVMDRAWDEKITVEFHDATTGRRCPVNSHVIATLATAGADPREVLVLSNIPGRAVVVQGGVSPAPDMRKVAEALGFEPDNHHNAAKCPYCTPPDGRGLLQTHVGDLDQMEAPDGEELPLLVGRAQADERGGTLEGAILAAWMMGARTAANIAMGRRTCRVCGCWENAACDDHGMGCAWVDHSLCSVCAAAEPRPEPAGVASLQAELIRGLVATQVEILAITLYMASEPASRGEPTWWRQRLDAKTEFRDRARAVMAEDLVKAYPGGAEAAEALLTSPSPGAMPLAPRQDRQGGCEMVRDARYPDKLFCRTCGAEQGQPCELPF